MKEVLGGEVESESRLVQHRFEYLGSLEEKEDLGSLPVGEGGFENPALATIDSRNLRLIFGYRHPKHPKAFVSIFMSD